MKLIKNKIMFRKRVVVCQIWFDDDDKEVFRLKGLIAAFSLPNIRKISWGKNLFVRILSSLTIDKKIQIFG